MTQIRTPQILNSTTSGALSAIFLSLIQFSDMLRFLLFLLLLPLSHSYPMVIPIRLATVPPSSSPSPSPQEFSLRHRFCSPTPSTSPSASVSPSVLPDFLGLTLSPCKKHADCTGDRYCYPSPTPIRYKNYYETPESSPEPLAEPSKAECAEKGCYCYPDEPAYCFDSSQCEYGECCVPYVRKFRRCVSKTALDIFGLECYYTDRRNNETHYRSIGDACNDYSDCRHLCGIRTGGEIDDSCPTNSTECQCLPPRAFEQKWGYSRYCVTSSQCQCGENCYNLPSHSTECYSENAAKKLNYFTVEETYQKKKGFTYDSCTLDDHCAEDRKCLQTYTGTDFVQCNGRIPCNCVPSILQDCSKTSDCTAEPECCERSSKTCMSATTLFPLFTECMQTRKPLENPSPSTNSSPSIPSATTSDSPEVVEDVCIAADSLRGFPREKLLFDQHQLAWVLCDSQLSCATAGHMVMFQGQSMMMKSYCDLVKCDRRISRVNSPKWERGLTINSNTEELQFLWFSARYATRTEQFLLSLFVRTGF